MASAPVENNIDFFAVGPGASALSRSAKAT